ncbi:hypothetical protein [Inhella sp.]|uniref:hypothetical protein n=1 Tax=Inhella sp. TaxID=1921806 RepID=UPI0035AE1EA9
MSRLLTIPQPASAALRPAQRKFNQLQEKIAAARKLLQAWDVALPAFTRLHQERVRPLRLEAERLRRDMAEQLDAWCQEKGWAQGERALMATLISELAREALEQHELPAAERPRWEELHDRHAELGFDAQNSHEMEVLKRMFEAQTGLDLGDEAFDTEADLLAHVRERLQTESEQREEQARRQAEASPPPPKRQSAAQKKRAAEAAAVAAQAKQSLREVFRKLASSLHPDRATDAADAARRTALMQRANAAYAKEDLLALLNLQLEIEQIDAAHLRQASDAQLQHFNAVLQEQLEELQAEIAMRERRLVADHELSPRRALHPERLAAVVADAVADWNAELFHAGRELGLLVTREGTKRWLKKLKAEARLG